MVNRKITKLLLLPGGLILLLVVFGFQLLNSSSFNDKSQIEEQWLDEIDSAYLKLFKEFKTLKLKNPSSKLKKSPTIPALKRDPFVRPDVSGIQSLASSSSRFFDANALELHGILWDETSPWAVINDEIVRVGSQLGSYRVKQIQMQRVVLASYNNKLVLQMPDE